ncbi:MAG: membrane integrity-associated transporter subunit PqiC [Ideonella sp.]|nr:membrane integrity-associated transporter subunit PqiC [Ideonella sp.]
MTRRTLMLALPAVLAACGASLLPKPAAAPARFGLDDGVTPGPRQTAPRQPLATAPVLLVASPRAASGLDSTRMLYLGAAGDLRAFAFHAWIDSPARLLAPLMVQTLQASGLFGAVLLAPSAGRATLRLETELLRLQHQFDTRPSRVHLALRAVLLDGTTRQVLGWRQFEAMADAPSEDAAGGVAAARTATRQLLAALGAACAGWMPPA